MKKRDGRFAPLAIVIAAFVLAAPAWAIASGTGTLQVRSIFQAEFEPATCPAGTAGSPSCYSAHAKAALRGLGKASMQFAIVEGEEQGTECSYPSIPLLPIVVAGKGEIDLSAKSDRCQPLLPPKTMSYSVVGGSGAYAGATGSGTVEFMSLIPGGTRTFVQTRIMGTIEAPGATFDLTPPTFSGIKNLVRSSKGKAVRVRFAVRATDDVDDAVAAACKPRSGSRFRIGKTRVTCSATDGSANEAKASFTVTVRKRR
jgi:HYR domain-containing protein